MSDLKDALAVLELPPKTTRSEVQKTYRTLLKVWHPDRFTGDPELQAEAEERTTRINLAYATVMDYLKTRQDAPQAGPSAEEARQRDRRRQEREAEEEQVRKDYYAVWVSVGVCLVLLALSAFGQWLSGFYSLVRWAVFGTATILSVDLNAWNDSPRIKPLPVWGWIMVAVALLFNPFLPFGFPRDTWVLLDLLSALLLFLASLKLTNAEAHSLARKWDAAHPR